MLPLPSLIAFIRPTMNEKNLFKLFVHRATEEVVIYDLQLGGKIVIRENIADIVLKEEHGQRVHSREVERVNVSEKNAELLSSQAQA